MTKKVVVNRNSKRRNKKTKMIFNESKKLGLRQPIKTVEESVDHLVVELV